MPVSRANAAFVRLAHPTEFGKYFNKEDPINPWVSQGYTRWTIREWEGTFGRNVEQENRKWEFFGYTIPLYDDPKT